MSKQVAVGISAKKNIAFLPALVILFNALPASAEEMPESDALTPQFVSILPVYVDSDRDRDADEGRGFRVGYGRSLDAKWYWETDVFGGVLETGNAAITDLYQLGASTGLSWSLYPATYLDHRL